MKVLAVFPQEYIAIVKHGKELWWESETTGEIVEIWKLHRVPDLIRVSKRCAE